LFIYLLLNQLNFLIFNLVDVFKVTGILTGKTVLKFNRQSFLSCSILLSFNFFVYFYHRGGPKRGVGGGLRPVAAPSVEIKKKQILSTRLHHMYYQTYGRLRLKCDGTRAETRVRLLAKRTSTFKSAGGVSSVDYWQPRCAHQR
jgi:hypothetical protein